jgi:hypothetical protein
MIERWKVVFVGGGIGLSAAQNLKSDLVDVTLIDRRNYHLFQPLLYQVATGSHSVLLAICCFLSYKIITECSPSRVLCHETTNCLEECGLSSLRSLSSAIATKKASMQPRLGPIEMPQLQSRVRFV